MSEILDFIDANCKELPKRPAGYGITNTEYSEAKGVSWNAAERVLSNLAKQGLLGVKKMREGGRYVKVYYRPENEH